MNLDYPVDIESLTEKCQIQIASLFLEKGKTISNAINWINPGKNNLLIKQAEQLSDFSKSLGLKIDEIVLSPENKNSKKPLITVSSVDFSKVKRIYQFLIAKDVGNLSNKQYIFQKKALVDIQRMPGLKKITKLQYELNQFFEIKSNSFGYYCLPEQKIKFVCESFLLRNPGFSNFNFKIKINADSTTITSSHIQLLNLSFNLIDDIEKASSVEGTYMLGSFEIVKEDYNEVKQSFEEILILLENIKFIEISDIHYKINFYLGCDYKMCRILFGQKASNSLNG